MEHKDLSGYVLDLDGTLVLPATPFGDERFIDDYLSPDKKTKMKPSFYMFEEEVPSVLEYAEKIFDDTYVVSSLGHGLFGEAYLLSDDTVVKFTSAKNEMECVQILFDLMEKDFDVYKSVFPIIYEYGEIDEIIRFQNSQFFIIVLEDSPKGKQDASVLPKFWYRREELMDLPKDEKGFSTSAYYLKEMNKKIDIAQDLGIELLDYGVNNWGIRPKTGEVIFRDLVCQE